uniref:Broad-range thermal receptor 1 n=1 Tax=Scolopendra mutilans TaxID=2836329 RepID=A0ABF7PQ79_SCOMU|nr:broad-range thermal receptor 1 protein [Scolopendra subspinipes]WCI13721.1 broad-range thermal receptor 1 [Scolopendra mutilans]
MAPSAYALDRSSVPSGKPRLMEGAESKARAGARKIHHLKIHGFDRVFGPGTHRWQRALWFAGVVFCFGISAHQIAMHVLDYLSEPVAVRIDFVAQNELRIPEITVCPRIFQQNTIFTDMVEKQGIDKMKFLDLIDRPEYDIMAVWNLSRIFSDNVSCSAHEGSSIISGSYVDPNMSQPHLVYTTSGQCINIPASRPLIYRGVNTFVRITDSQPRNLDEVRPEAIQIYFHEHHHAHLSRYLTGLRGYIVPIANPFAFSIRFTQINYANKTDSPCVDSEEYAACVEDFIEQRIYEKAQVQCRLPYMRPKLPLCSTPTDARKIFVATDDVIQNFEKESSCKRKCEETLYIVEFMHLFERSNISIDMSVYFAYNYIQVATEYLTYTLRGLLSDIGGVLGLFLGICILSVIEVFEVVIFSLQRVLCNEDKKQQNNE